MESATRGTREMVASLAKGTTVDSDVHRHKETAASQRQAPSGDYDRSATSKTASPSSPQETKKEPAVDYEFELPHVPEERDPTTSTTTLPPPTQHQSSTERMPQPEMTTLRRSNRQRRAPDRWGYSNRT
ncbi:hypothetical protein MTO96_046279 [Rhipicephalus appendiculatus]